MKNIYILIVLMSVILPARSQSNKMINKYRVSSYSHYYANPKSTPAYQLYLSDSGNFYYSGNRHSYFYYCNDYNSGGMGYPFISNPWQIGLDLNNIDSINYPSVNFDTFIGYTLNRWGMPIDTSMCLYRRYSTGDTLIFNTFKSYIYGVRTADSGISILLYSNGKLTKSFNINHSVTRSDTIHARYLRYNAIGQLVCDSILELSNGKLIPQYRLIYTYNTGGLYIKKLIQFYVASTSTFRDTNAYQYAYYPSGRVKTLAMESILRKNLILQPFMLDSFGYNTGVLNYTYHERKMFDSSGNITADGFQIAKHINTSVNIADSFVNYGFNTGSGKIDSGGSFKYIHDADGNVLRSLAYGHDGSKKVLGEVFNYSYEKYRIDDSVHATGIPYVISVTQQVVVSPNPTTGRITINHSDLKAGTPITIFISNTAGQAVHAETLSAQGSKIVVTLGDEAPPGIYNIRVSATGGAALYSGTLMKL